MVNKATFTAVSKDLSIDVNGRKAKVKWLGKQSVMMSFLDLLGISSNQVTVA
jgi:hypothetical protein